MVFALTLHPPTPVGVADLLLRREGGDVLARLYYPAAPTHSAFIWPLYRPAWLPHRRSLNGFMSFVLSDLDTGIPKQPRGLLFRMLRWVVMGAGGVLSHLMLRVPAIWHARPALDGTPRVVLLSHGLGGTRAVYSSHALALAAQGFLVVAAEHSDGTASLTCTYEEGGVRSYRSYEGCGRKGERHPRVEHRCGELSALADFVCALAAGEALPHAPLLLYGGQALLGQLSGRVDVKELSVVGHSFGGATALALARRDARVATCVAHDPWLPALTGAPEALSLTARGPWPHPSSVLITLCESWMADGTHLPEDLRAALGAIRAGGGVAACAGLRGFNHHMISDASLAMKPGKRVSVLEAQKPVFAAVGVWCGSRAAVMEGGGERLLVETLGEGLLAVGLAHGEER